MMTITYPVKTGIYVNMTNRCPCACTFCLRHNGEGVYGSDSLWLEREPTVQEVCDSIDSYDAMLRFTKDCTDYVPNVVMTVVDTVTSKEEQETCRKICKSVGATLRVRPYEG